MPIVYQTRDGLAIDYKEYGIKLQVTPELKGSGKILVDIEAEVSGLDFSVENEATGVPGFLTRRVSSKGLVEEGQTNSFGRDLSKKLAKEYESSTGFRSFATIHFCTEKRK